MERISPKRWNTRLMSMEPTLEDRVDFIRSQIDDGECRIAAQESALLIEFALRELYGRSLNEIDGKARQRAMQLELEIGRGQGRSYTKFTFGELVRLYRESEFLRAWASATGAELRALQMVNLDEIVRLRNKFSHELYEVRRGEAQFLFHVLQIILETFGILRVHHRIRFAV